MSAVMADSESQLDGEVRRAWDAYREQTGELDGATYEQVEAEAWTVLRGELRRLERRRRLLNLSR